MADIKLTEEQVDFIKGVCKSFNNEGGEVINVLHKVQGETATSQLKCKPLSLRN